MLTSLIERYHSGMILTELIKKFGEIEGGKVFNIIKKCRVVDKEIKDKVFQYPEELFYSYNEKCTRPHGVGYINNPGYSIAFSMNYNTEWDKEVAREIVRCWNKEHGKENIDILDSISNIVEKEESLHNHPHLERKLGVDEGHVIIDRHTFLRLKEKGL